jgi:hypothetical protein
MSRWLEQLNVVQCFVVMWVITATAALGGAAVGAWLSSGQMNFEAVTFGSLAFAIFATMGLQMRKRTGRAGGNSGS